jgi:biotin synthase-related radical SAM superfamily protein
MSISELNGTIKARLVSIGSVSIVDCLIDDPLITEATAGPGAGGRSIFLQSGGHRVRLSINPHSPLSLEPWGDEVVVVQGEEMIVRGRLERPLCHCPKQTYITLSEQCIFDCKFCPVPKLKGGVKDQTTILNMVDEAAATGELEAISLTSGVAKSPEDEVRRVVEVVRALRKKYSLPIGVSVYPTSTSSEDLKAAGADEIKYNVETMDPAIFARVCPGLSLEYILEALKKAVPIFGKNHVFSNLILGIGERDENVLAGVRTLAGMGVIPVLRPISKSPYRNGDITVERPSAERLLHLARQTKRILWTFNLDPSQAMTMCLPCTGCDITPFRDV